MPTDIIGDLKTEYGAKYRQIVQRSAHGQSVDLTELPQVLAIVGKSADNLRCDIQLLQAAIDKTAELAAKDYDTKIAERSEMLREGAELRKEIEADQKAIDARWSQLRQLEEIGRHKHALVQTRDAQERELAAFIRKTLGVGKLSDFPPLG